MERTAEDIGRRARTSGTTASEAAHLKSLLILLGIAAVHLMSSDRQPARPARPKTALIQRTIQRAARTVGPSGTARTTCCVRSGTSNVAVDSTGHSSSPSDVIGLSASASSGIQDRVDTAYYSVGESAERTRSSAILKECLASQCATEQKFKLLDAKASEVTK